MRHFSITADVNASTSRVWEVMSDIDRWHEWSPSINSVQRVGNAPFAVGSRAVVRQPRFPPALWKITEIVPGRSFTWVSTAPGLRVIARHGAEPTPTGSRVTLSLDFQGMLGGAFGRMTRDINQRYITFEVNGLKARSEDPAYRKTMVAS